MHIKWDEVNGSYPIINLINEKKGKKRKKKKKGNVINYTLKWRRI